MPRSARSSWPDGIYHIYARGNRRQTIFVDDTCYERFEALLIDSIRLFNWRCESYCFVGNHYHLQLRATQPDLSRGMHRLNFRYAIWFNRRYEVDGHLLQGRFAARMVEGEHLLRLPRYIALNPWRHGFCNHPLDWRWGSFRAIAGRARVPDFLSLDWLVPLFGPDLPTARRNFVIYVEESVVQSPWDYAA